MPCRYLGGLNPRISKGEVFLADIHDQELLSGFVKVAATSSQRLLDINTSHAGEFSQQLLLLSQVIESSRKPSGSCPLGLSLLLLFT